MRAAHIALLAALAALPAAAYAAEVQFHIITESGNTFLIEPPDLPRPANIISETAHLVVRNPPAGMFVATAPNGTTHKFTPLQSGLDLTGFAGGTVRVIFGTDWDAAPDRTFRDQAFGTMSGDPMRHARTMPLAAGWNGTYTLVPLRDSSAFGLGAMGPNNTIPGMSADANGGYRVTMGSRERVGLDFGPGGGTDQTYYIYRGCSSCMDNVVIGHGDPTDHNEALPNDLGITDHYRGWKSTGSCAIIENSQWNGRGTRTLSDSYTIPAVAHSRASDHYIDSRYDDLSVLPQSHSTCGGLNVTYSADGRDNRKHDMCVTSTGWSSTTTYRYPITTTKETTITRNNNGTIETTTTTTTQTSSATRTATGSCATPTTSGTSDGYQVSARCSGGGPLSNPPTSSSFSGPTQCTAVPRQCVRTTTTVTVGSPGVTTNAGVWSTCSLTTNTPHLDLEDAMTLRPGLNLWRPPPVPAGHNLIVVYDDTENGGGGNEYVQVFRHPGSGPDPAGPYSFHLRPATSGILYDMHRHYGWVDTRTYGTDQLADMGYVARSAMAGHGDGLRPDGGHPYVDGTRLCHGDCFMGVEGIDGGKPAIRAVSPASSHAVSAAEQGLVYDHLNGMWFTDHWAGLDGQVTGGTLYLLIPFAEDVNLVRVYLYGSGFDPTAQLPSPRDAPGTGPWCHMSQSGSLYAFAASMSVSAGDSLAIPVLPKVRYAAFIGNGDCYWYDISSLPSPLSSVASGARHVPLANGTVLSGDLTARRDGAVHVDVVADLEAVWQLEAYGMTAGPGAANATWAVPPLEVEVVAVARVNGAPGSCGSSGVYCSAPVMMAGAAVGQGTYIHGVPFQHGLPYAEAPVPLPSVALAGTGVYGLPDGRCYGLESVSAATGGLVVRDIPRIRVLAGDTITLSFNATVSLPETVGGGVAMAEPPGHVCMLAESVQTATLDIRTMTATLR